ncbi:hypothetical protein Tco_1020737 [Tanacetum coccineum]
MRRRHHDICDDIRIFPTASNAQEGDITKQDRKPSKLHKTEHGMNKTCAKSRPKVHPNHAQLPPSEFKYEESAVKPEPDNPKSESILKNQQSNRSRN